LTVCRLPEIRKRKFIIRVAVFIVAVLVVVVVVVEITEQEY
jgi:predicted nucleic acid-binding Zn ribbon protein